MADAKISALTAIDAVAAADLFPIVDDPAGTPVTKKATASQIKDYILGLANTWTAAQTISVNGAVSAPAFTGTGTWYSGGSATTTKPYWLIEPTGTTSTGWSTSGTGIGVNAATGFAGNLIDAQVNGSRVFGFRQDGRITFGLAANYWMEGNTGAEAIYFGMSTSTYNMAVGNASTKLSSTWLLGWTSGNAQQSLDLILARDAANTLALRNGTNAQTFRVYNTESSSLTNYERLNLAWSSNVMQLTTTAAGTGSARALSLGVGATGQWQIDTSGHFAPTANATYDIGISGGNKPRAVYADSFNAVAGVVRSTYINNGNNANSIFQMPDSSEHCTFSVGGTAPLFRFAGTTSSFPALKRSSTVLQARLADDSGFAPLQGNLRTQANAVAETPTATHTMIITDAGGTAYRVLCVV